MVYVFLVDAGIMWTFDVSYALKSVSHLAQAIEEACGIPIEKQVLIVSGGESLDPNSRVCVYSAGTDTNPFFLFRRIDYECGPPSYDVDVAHDVDVRQEVEKATQLPPSYETVEHRAQLAKKFCELAIEQTNICKQLVHEQHLQQQGWAASLANMDDCVSSVQRNLDFVERTVRNHVSKIDHFKNLLATFNEVVEKLSQVPLPQALLVGGGAFMEDLITSLRSAGKSGLADEIVTPQITNDESPGSFEKNENFPTDTAGSSDVEPMVVSKKSVSSSSLNADISLKGEMEASLLQWIHHHDEKGTMKLLVDNCQRGLNQFGEDLLEELKEERERLVGDLHVPNVKEIKGLEGRLYTLEQFMHQAKTLVQEQSELSQSFNQNQNRCNQFGDASILPDLCLLHARQLAVMEDNHSKIREIRRRCANAKTELCMSLFHRLKWIVYVESRIAQLSYKLTIMNEGLKRLEANLELLSELHAAPQKYLMAVGEVVRRRLFSTTFLKWGQALTTQMLSIYNEEIARRKEFDANFEDHFVRLMFPGLDDCPLPFATEPPRPFDVDLPKLSLSDLEMIRSKLPDVAKDVPAPEITDTMSHLMCVVTECLEPGKKDKPVKTEEEHRGLNEVDPKSDVQPLKMRKIALTGSTPQLKDDRGFESETDTEEFENVGQSPVDLVFEDRPAHAASTASAATANTVEQSTIRTDNALVNMRELGKAAAALVHLLRSDLLELRQKVDAEGKNIPTMLSEFRASWDVNQAFIKGQSSIQPEATSADEKEMTVTDTVEALDGGNRVAELEKLLEECSKREQELREELVLRDAKEEDFKRVTGELERRLEDVEKYRVHCDELQRRLDDNLECQEMESSYQDQVQTLEAEKAVLTEQAANERVNKESLMCELEKLQQSLVTAEGQKNAALKEQAAKLLQEHRAEVANMRSRFRLMTRSNMERSPSESSLEAEKVDVAEMSKEIVAAQLNEKMAKERDAKIREAVLATRKEMELKLKTELKSMQLKMEAEKQVWFTDTMRRIMSDKERQISTFLEREAKLKLECSKLRKSIQSMNDTNTPFVVGADLLTGSSKFSPLSVSEMEKHHRTLSRSTCALLQREVKTTSCDPGDVVQIVWDQAHLNFLVVQLKDALYFVHSDSLEALGLPTGKIQPGLRPITTSCLATVVDKEYCQARKPENRFHVERGTKFYRVKLSPVRGEPLVTTATQCDPQALSSLERSENSTPELSLSITCSGPSSAISDDEPPPDTPDMTS